MAQYLADLLPKGAMLVLTNSMGPWHEAQPSPHFDLRHHPATRSSSPWSPSTLTRLICLLHSLRGRGRAGKIELERLEGVIGFPFVLMSGDRGSLRAIGTGARGAMYNHPPYL